MELPIAWGMRISEIMSQPVETIGENETVDAVRARLDLHRIHHLVVMDGKQIVGVVSERDVRGWTGATPVAEVMSPAVVVADPDMTVREAANRLRGRGIGCLPIVDRGKLVGMVSVVDILALLGKGAQRPVEQGKRWTLKHRGPRGHRRSS